MTVFSNTSYTPEQLQVYLAKAIAIVLDHEAHGTDLSPEVRYDELARALGCHGEHVTTLDELAPAIERARSSGLPAVLHVEVDPDINANPIGYEQFRSARTY